MSCLSITELPISEQVEISLAQADRLTARTADVLNAFDSRGAGRHPPYVSRPRESNPTSKEDPHVLERQLQQHPPLRTCNCIRAPYMYEARGDSVVRYYVECSPCGLRSPRLATSAAAAEAWNARDLVHYDVPEVA